MNHGYENGKCEAAKQQSSIDNEANRVCAIIENTRNNIDRAQILKKRLFGVFPQADKLQEANSPPDGDMNRLKESISEMGRVSDELSSVISYLIESL